MGADWIRCRRNAGNCIFERKKEKEEVVEEAKDRRFPTEYERQKEGERFCISLPSS